MLGGGGVGAIGPHPMKGFLNGLLTRACGKKKVPLDTDYLTLC